MIRRSVCRFAAVAPGYALAMKRLAWMGGLAAAGTVLVRKLRSRGEERRSMDTGDDFRTPAPASPPPPERTPPSEADPADREAESRLDPQSAYDRALEDEESERAAAAEALRADPPAPDTSDET
jgi:hypothetical protein